VAQNEKIRKLLEQLEIGDAYLPWPKQGEPWRSLREDRNAFLAGHWNGEMPEDVRERLYNPDYPGHPARKFNPKFTPDEPNFDDDPMNAPYNCCHVPRAAWEQSKNNAWYFYKDKVLEEESRRIFESPAFVHARLEIAERMLDQSLDILNDPEVKEAANRVMDFDAFMDYVREEYPYTPDGEPDSDPFEMFPRQEQGMKMR
jgi:hypothetical protein